MAKIRDNIKGRIISLPIYKIKPKARIPTRIRDI